MSPIILVLCVFLAYVCPAFASCEDAVSAYNSSTSEIEYNLRRYSRCVEASQGRDDCYSEFRRLRSAHSDFESAVSQYQSECR